MAEKKNYFILYQASTLCTTIGLEKTVKWDLNWLGEDSFGKLKIQITFSTVLLRYLYLRMVNTILKCSKILSFSVDFSSFIFRVPY